MSKIRAKGKNLAEARIRKFLTVKELAEMTSVNVAIICRSENGKSSPNPKAAKAICEALGAEFDDLFEIV